jgi:anionic cell wall polymer biosynthesis LytR-Cps2A-Psr (LCP) family protein
LRYVRFRHDRENDFGRVQRQQEITSKLIHEAADVGTLVKLQKLWGIVDTYVETNLPKTTLLTVRKDFILGETQEMQTL